MAGGRKGREGVCLCACLLCLTLSILSNSVTKQNFHNKLLPLAKSVSEEEL
jgi:hypothetical protein